MNEWNDAEKRVRRAHKLYEQGRWAEAAAELRAAIEVNSDNPAWHFNLAVTLEAMEDYAHACDAYQTAIELNGRDLEAMNCLGVNFTRLSRYAEALECFRKIEHIDPLYEPGYCNRIVTYTEMGDHDNAELMFYMARQIKAECPLCYYNIGNTFYSRGLYLKAIQCWQQTLRLDAGHPDANLRIAEAYWALRDLPNAKVHYQAELQQLPEDVDVLLDYGELLSEMGELKDARVAFRGAIDLVPDHAGAHFCLGELALKEDRLPEAEELFRTVLQLDQEFPCGHMRLGQVLLRRGQAEQAARYFLKELRHSHNDPEMLQELGQLLLEAGQAPHANFVLQRLVVLRPSDPRAQHDLAVSLFMLERFDEGIRHCRKAIKLKPDYALALYNLALAHMRKGQIDRARRYVSRALVISPDSEPIRRLSRRMGLWGIWARIRSRFSPAQKNRS